MYDALKYFQWTAANFLLIWQIAVLLYIRKREALVYRFHVIGMFNTSPARLPSVSFVLFEYGYIYCRYIENIMLILNVFLMNKYSKHHEKRNEMDLWLTADLLDF